MGRFREEKRRGEERREEKRREEERRSKKRKSQKKEDPGARKGRKVAKHSVFPMICGSGGSKSRLAKAAGAEPAGQMRDEKVHAVVARSTFESEKAKCKSTSRSEHFWKLRCRKSARRCGAKHVSKSKVEKTEGHGALLDVQMSFCVAGARDYAPCQKWAKREGMWGFCRISKNNGRRGAFEEDLQRYIFRGRRSTMQSIDWLKNLALKFSVIVVAMATSIGPLGFKGWHQQKADGDAGNPRLGWQDGLDEKAQGTCFCLRRH